MKKDSFIFKASENHVGLRLDKALGQHEQIGSRSKAEFLIAQELVLFKGKPAKASHRLALMDEFVVQIPEPEVTQITPLSLDLEIPFEDEHIVIVNKPAGLVVHPAAGHANDTLVNALVGTLGDFEMKFGENRPGIVHRLDKDTSGLLVIAKNDKAQENLVAQFKDRSVYRRYQALVWAAHLPPKGSAQSYLARHPTDRKRYASVRDASRKIITDPDLTLPVGKWAKTNFEVLKKTANGLTLLSLRLETGRTHQIRVHLSESGAPIVADPIYGNKKTQGFSKSEKEIITMIPRLCLHAAELGFKHPVSLEAMSFKASWPEDLSGYLRELGFGEVMA